MRVPARVKRLSGRQGRALRIGAIRATAILAALSLLLVDGGGDGITAVATFPRPSGGSGHHHTAAAPVQRWGSATGQDHLVGSSGNHTQPTTLRSTYPLREPAAVAKPKPNPASVVAPPARAVHGFDAKTSTEQPGRRGAYDTTYANSDGTETTEFSTTPVNYRRGDGSWAPIDSRLTPAAGGWQNTADSVHVTLAGRADAASLASLQFDTGHALSFALDGATGVTGTASGNTVVYPGARPDTDVRLDSVDGGVKETLVLRSSRAPTSYLFPLRLSGLSATLAGGDVVLIDASGTRRAVIPAGSMSDSAGATGGPATSTAVTYQLTGSGDRLALKVTLDAGWLADPARVFPVLVDPSVASSAADSSLVVRGGSGSSGSNELLVGDVGGSIASSYIKFGGLASQLQYQTIYGAQLQVVNYDAGSCKARPVGVYPVTSSWSSSSNTAPSVGAALASRSFAYGYIGLGQSQSSCPTSAVLFDLGEAGRKLVQGWVNGQANNGLSLRTSSTEATAWKGFAGTSTANPPRLYVTHSPYNATYSVPSPVPTPPVLQNQSGTVKVTVTNLSAEAWTAGNYYLAYRAYNAVTGKAVTQQRSANLTATVARNAKVTLDATIKALPPGKYFLDFTMVRSGGPVFTDEQVPPGRIVIQVFDIPPVFQALFPPNGYEAQTLTPQLWANALDIDAPAGSSLQYKFEVCEQDASGNPVNCTTTAYQATPEWTATAGLLKWSKTYLWRSFVKDASNEVASDRSALLTSVPQPEVTSHVANAPYGTQDKEYDPQVGNYTTAALDASEATAGPALTLVRTYNSLDPRRTSLFGAGWTTQYDMKLVPDNDGTGNVVVSYPDGEEVRFGKNPDGTFAPPAGRAAQLTPDGSGGWTLLDKTGATYQFAAGGRLYKISDVALRSVVLTYDATGKLAKAQVSNSLTNTAGRSLTFAWSGAHVATVSTDPVNGAPLTWSYTYTGDLLTRACAPGSVCTNYDYASGSHYRGTVLDDRAEAYYRLGESSGTAAGSQIAVNLGKDAGTYHNVTLGAAGAVTGAADTAGTFNGTSSYLDLPKGLVKKSRDVAVEVWFKASVTGSGGPLVGYQNAAIGQASTLGVPVLYQGTDGKLHGQFWTGTATPITSTKLVNDGKWHHAVLSAMGNTQTLYLDGAVAGTLTASPADTSALTYNQVGAGYASSPASWPGWGTTAQRYYNGVIDEVASYTHPLGPTAVAAHYQYATAAADQLTTVTLPSGKVATQVGYDADLDRVSTYTDDNGGTWKIGAPVVYGGDTDLRRAVQVLDPSGRPYLYEYDALAGRMVRSGAPMAMSIKDEDKADYTPPTPSPTPTPTQVCSSPDPGDPQFCTTIPGDADGPVFEGHDLDGVAIRTFSYDANGFQNLVTNENGDAVTMTYDDRGNVTSTKTCRAPTDCHTTYNTYPATVTNPFDPRNDVPTQTRDARSASATDNTYRTSYTYSSTGEVATQTNPDNSTTRNAFTTGAEAAYHGGNMPPGLLLSSTSPRGAVTRYSYYANGDLGQTVDPSGLVTTFVYDAIGRKISETEVSDAIPAGVTTVYTYDALSRLLTTTEPVTTDAVTNVRHQGRTTNTYDVDGNVTEVEAADLLGGDPPRVTSYDYDDHNRVDRITDALGNETSYGYDKFGNRTSMVDANGNQYEYGYTARNAIAEVRLRNWQGDPDGAGDPGPGGELVLHSYAYDFAGRMVRDTDAMGHQLQYDYYGDDLLKKITLKGMRNPDGSTRDYVVESDSYDGAGNLTEQDTANGTTITRYTIGLNGQVATSVADPTGLARATSFSYDADGNVSEVKTAGNFSNVPWPMSTTAKVVDYTYDLAGNQTRQTQTAAGTSQVSTYTYDQRGLLTSSTGPRGNAAGANAAMYTTRYGYDAMGRQTTVTMPAVATETNGGAPFTTNPVQLVGYDTFDESVESEDELGNVSRVGYDTLGRVVTSTAPPYPLPGGATITPISHTSYDPLGNVTETDDPRGNATRYTYDQLNHVLTRDGPGADNDERAVWHYTYTRTGDVLSVTDPTGARVQTTYDDLDRPVTLTQVERRPVADNFTSHYTYDDAGNVTSLSSPTGATTSSIYDKLGQLTKSTDPSGVSTQYGYDSDGRQVRQTDGLGRTSQINYDGFGRAVSDMDLDTGGNVLRTEHYDYDLAGNLTASTDPLLHATTYQYDALNELVSQTEAVSDASSITTSFGYDAAGERTRYTDGRGNSTIYTYNSLGLPQAVIEPATTAQPGLADRTWAATYDAGGEPVAMTAPGGVTDQRTFDAAGRLTKETGTGAEANTADRMLSYDLAGRLTRASAPGGTDSYTYDDRGLMLTAAGPSGTGSFGYDGDGQVTSRTDAAGTAQFGYVKGRLSTQTDGITGSKQTLGYDAAGQLSSVDYGAGRVRSFGYDAFGRTASDTLKNGAQQVVSSIAYGYDLNDNMTSKTTTGTVGAAANTYGYDYDGRLTSWTNGSAGTTQYEWDASGNRTRDGTKTARYDQRDRVLSDGEYTYDYSARGDLASRTSSGYTEDFSFDAFDRLIADDGHGYSYDGLDRLASRDSTTFSYAGQDDEVVSDGTTDYAYGALDELLAVGQGQQEQLSLTDQHGDVVGDFAASDTTLSGLDASTAYDPFGNVIASDGDDGDVGYQGDWTDPDTDQVDMGARWYDPGSGTFDSRDDVGYTSGDSILANRYTYAAGDPMDETDPDGHWPSCGWCHKAAHAVTSAVKSVATTVYHAAVSVAQYAWSGMKAVAHAISSAVSYVYHKAKAAVSYVVHKVVSAAKWVYNKAAAAAQWAAQKAAQAKAAALAVARHVTAVAKSAAKWAAAHNPLPAIAAAVKPIYSGLKKVVSASAHIAAAVVSTVRDVVQDVAKSVQVVYQKAVQAAGAVVQAVDTAAQAVSEFAQAHAAEIAGIAAGALVGIGCGLAIGWTGVGAVACGALAGAVGGAVANAMSCPPGHSIAGCAAIGAVAGGVGGAIAALTAGAGGGFAMAMLGGGLSAAGSDATSQLLTTGHVDVGEVVEQGVVGAATGGLMHGAGKLAGGRVPAAAGCGGNSFAAGTTVLMADGTHKPIEDVRIGDKVVATDPTTGKTSIQPVTDVIVGSGSKNLVAITVATAAGTAGALAGLATITATDRHPFWVDDRGQPVSHDPSAGGHWEDAYSLTPGETLSGTSGAGADVVATRAYTKNTTVYNLTVDAMHTFYVVAGSTPVLVHNCETPTELHAFGNASGPRPPRPQDMEVGPDGMLVPQSGPSTTGASTMGDPNEASLTGPYYRIPAGTELPEGFGVVADGEDVLPGSGNPRTHHTIFPTRPMTPEEFAEGFQSLPWTRAGRKK